MHARLVVRVTPRGGRDAIDGWDSDTLRVRVAAAPAGGRANEALLRVLAKALGVPPSRLALMSGAHGRLKTVEVEGMTAAAVRGALAGPEAGSGARTSGVARQPRTGGR